MKTFRFKLITPEKLAYDDDIESITVMTEVGQITVLPGHDRLVTVIVPGELHVIKSGEKIPFVVGQGALSIDHDLVELLVNTTESVSDIDVARAEESLRHARTVLDSRADASDVDYARFEALMARNMARIKAKQK